MMLRIRKAGLAVESKKPATTQYFTDDYRSIIKEKINLFMKRIIYLKKIILNMSSKNILEMIIGLLDNYVRSGQVQNFSKKDLKSWAYCLYNSLKFRNSNIKNGTVIYSSQKKLFSRIVLLLDISIEKDEFS